MTEFYLISKFAGFRSNGEVAELAEGARLLSEYRGTPSIVGSNPTLSARNTRRIRLTGKSAVLKTAAGNRL